MTTTVTSSQQKYSDITHKIQPITIGFSLTQYAHTILTAIFLVNLG